MKDVGAGSLTSWIMEGAVRCEWHKQELRDPSLLRLGVDDDSRLLAGSDKIDRKCSKFGYYVYIF